MSTSITDLFLLDSHCPVNFVFGPYIVSASSPVLISNMGRGRKLKPRVSEQKHERDATLVHGPATVSEHDSLWDPSSGVEIPPHKSRDSPQPKDRELRFIGKERNDTTRSQERSLSKGTLRIFVTATRANALHCRKYRSCYTKTCQACLSPNRHRSGHSSPQMSNPHLAVELVGSGRTRTPELDAVLSTPCGPFWSTLQVRTQSTWCLILLRSHVSLMETVQHKYRKEISTFYVLGGEDLFL